MKAKVLFLAAVCVSLLASAKDGQPAMQPRILNGDTSHCGAILVQDGHLKREEVCTRVRTGQVAWDGHVADITWADEKASADWISAHSLVPRLSIKHGNLYWDGKKVDLGKIDVTNVYEAFPWQGGVMIYGRTFPRRHFWQEWPFKGPFIEVRDLEPFCAIYFDPRTMKGEDVWLNGKAYLGFFVFPIPAE